MAARVSVPYCIAIAAVDGKLTQAQFSPARINDPLLRQVLANTEIIADAELNKLYPDKFPARVTITLKDGTSFQETVLFPKGDPQDPLSADEIDGEISRQRRRDGWARRARVNCCRRFTPCPRRTTSERLSALLHA